MFLKKPCINTFFEGNYDVVLQHIEDENQIKCDGYVNAYKILNNYGIFNGFPLHHTTPSNVGVIGFNNQKLKDEYLNLYQKCVDFYKVTINDYKENKLFIPDLYFEQININWLISEKKYNTLYLLPQLCYGDFNLHKIAKEIGYQHLIGSWKYSENGREFLDTFLDGLSINKKPQLKIIWASPCIGKSYLALNDERFIDFDKITHEYFEKHELFEHWEISLLDYDDMSKKIKEYPALRKLIYDILFCGRSVPFNIGTELVAIGSMFGFLKDEEGQVAISNRIFEIWFYNLFIAEEAINSETYHAGQENNT